MDRAREQYDAAVAQVAANRVNATLPPFVGPGTTVDPTARLEGSSIEDRGENNLIVIGEGVLLEKTKIIVNGDDSTLLIGPRSTLRSTRISMSDDAGVVVLGSTVAWRSGQLFCSSRPKRRPEAPEISVLIGDDQMFAAQSLIRTADGHGIFDLNTQARLNENESVVIHEHVWLANGVRVGKGSVIGAGSIVGQNSIVSGRLDPQCVYAGAPARKRRENIAWSRGQAFPSVPEKFKRPLDETS